MPKLLSNKEIEALQPKEKPYHVKWAEGVDGAWLRIRGPRKTFLYTYVGRTMTFGSYPVIDSPTALKMLRAAHASRDAGHDPQAAKQQRKEQARQDQQESVAACVVTYIEACKKKGERAWATKESTLRRFVVPRFGTRPIRSLTRRDIVQFVDAIDAEHGTNVARSAFSKLSGLLSFAQRKDMIEHLPTTNIELPGKVSVRSRLLSDQELALVWEGSGRLAYPDKEFIRLLLLTAQRRNQIAGLTRSEVSISERVITWSGDRMKSGHEHSIPICDEVLRVILSLPVHGVHCLSCDAGKSAMCSFARSKKRLDAAIAAIAKARGIQQPTGWTFHDLRRTSRSRMADCGVSRDSAELVLAHRLGDSVSQVYNRSAHLLQKAEALQRWESYVMGIVEKWQVAA